MGLHGLFGASDEITMFLETGIEGPQGPKGDKGDKGDQGPKGDQGERGQKGDAFTYEDFTAEQLSALTGPRGLKGDKGDKGDTGDQGPKGDTGPTGPAGIVLSETEPDDPSHPVWLDPTGEPDDVTVAELARRIGELDELTTSAKDNLVHAINEAAQTGSGGGGGLTDDEALEALDECGIVHPAAADSATLYIAADNTIITL